MSIPETGLIRRFALIYLGCAIVLSVILFTVARYDDHARLAQLAASELRYVGVARVRAEKDFEPAEGDIHIIANMDDLRQYVENGDPLHREKVEQYFMLLAQGRQHYYQIRYLDADGREKIRINFKDGKGVVVPREELQDKSAYYYFHDAKQLVRNKIYVSPLDLNVEHDRVEIPYRPVVRFAAPVFDSAGHKRGLVVLNYIADEMLKHFHEAMLSSEAGSGMLLNSEGYWLSSPNPRDEWGFMLGKPDRTFGHDYPEAWRRISTTDTGTLLTARGLFTFATAHPLLDDAHAFPGSPGWTVTGGESHSGLGYNWKIVSFIPTAALSAGAFYNKPVGRVLIVSAYLLLALVILGIVLVAAKQKKAEEAIRLMALLLELAPGPVMRIDRSGTICLANTASKHLYGIDEVEGMSIFSAIPALAREEFEDMFGAAEKIVQVEEKLGDANYFFVLKSGPKRKYVFAYGTDISLIKLLEEQVRHAQKMEVVGQLASGVAHDFNTLLGVILGYSEMLRETLPEDSVNRANIEAIMNAGGRAKALVIQLMDFSRLGTTEQETISLASLLQDSISLLKPSLPEWISIRQDIQENTGMIEANAMQIGQVIMNLCMNAADAIGDTAGELRISLMETEVDDSMASAHMVEPGTYLQLSIADNGSGMDEATMQHLFEPFFTTKDIGSGTGLGLAVVHGIIKSHGGFVTVESEPGTGSSFHVYLPKVMESQVRNGD
ncbi:ATP-binding protein [Mariprofundus ferrooxydans]|uniref:histidine kinase n=1 Tax=Mariprofundus ferrooxydans PV-1 TaxID=314345 RepID=Q0EX12_9PROT|nr:ATP-binding protein [Mariprofundus ferrooxydans]EAU53862.1 multi-sensor signal transduction histidine kinase [Mariprofundus ferrooxydans PV-1]